MKNKYYENYNFSHGNLFCNTGISMNKKQNATYTLDTTDKQKKLP